MIKGMNRLELFAAQNRLSSYVSNDLLARIANPIKFRVVPKRVSAKIQTETRPVWRVTENVLASGLMRGVFAEIRRDAPFYGALGLYALATFVMAAWLGQTQKYAPLLYVGRWISGTASATSLGIVIVAVLSLKATSPVQEFKRRIVGLASPSFLAGLLLFLSLALLHGVFTSAKTLLPDITPFYADRPLADLDAELHGGRDPWTYLRWLEPYTGHIQYLYSAWWSFLLIATSMAVCLWGRLRAIRSQYLWTFLLCWVLLGNIVAGLFMSGGPIFYDHVTGDAQRYAEPLQHISHFDSDGVSVMAIRAMLWAIYEGQVVGLGSGISAFPSLHVAMATLFALVAFRVHWLAGVVLGAFAIVILLGSVHLGWHYAVDGYFSGLATVSLWSVVGYLLEPGRASSVARPARATP